MPNGNRYESTLERDLMILMEFSEDARSFLPQPLTLSYCDPNGRLRRYTPDGLIEWHPDASGRARAPLLVEVKYREAFRHEWRSWRHRIRAVQEHAAQCGWQFRVFTEREIRTPRLNNARFLLPYRRMSANEMQERQIMDALMHLESATPRSLLQTMSSDASIQASVLPSLWRLLSHGNIACDSNVALGMGSAIWPARGERG